MLFVPYTRREMLLRAPTWFSLMSYIPVRNDFGCNMIRAGHNCKLDKVAYLPIQCHGRTTVAERSFLPHNSVGLLCHCFVIQFLPLVCW